MEKFMKQYSFLKLIENCAAGITAYESPATNSGTFDDVYGKKKRIKKLKKKIKDAAIVR